MKLKKFFMFIMLVLLAVNLYPETYKREDPFLAGALSWYMAGLGQIYAGKYLKGAVFWIVDYTLYISSILSVADINFSSNEEIGFQLNIKPKKYLTSKQKNVALALVISYVSFHIYNVIDAVRTVNEHNKKLEELKSNQSFYFDYQNKNNNHFFGIAYNF
jgi:TM2 domain-containing membrane protein YozV